MKYVQPADQPSNPTAPYVDLNAVAGTEGSVPPAKFFNNMQAEVLAVITAAGLAPSDSDLTQLLEAIRALMPTVSGPSDASLVHFATDSGVVNALNLTPSIAMAALPAGALILTVPITTSTAPTNVTVATAGGAVTKAALRDDGSALLPGDILTGRLTALVYDGVRFRVVWCARKVLVDGVTIAGDGVSTPLVAQISLAGLAQVFPGVGSTWVTQMLGDVYPHFTIGQTYSGDPALPSQGMWECINITGPGFNTLAGLFPMYVMTRVL